MMTPIELKEKLRGNLTFTELVKTIEEAQALSFSKKEIKIGFSSNITVDQSQYFFKQQCFLKDLSCSVIYGDYNSHFHNVNRFVSEQVDTIILQSVFDNIQPSFESQVLHLDDQQIIEVENTFFTELSMNLQGAKSCKNVVIDKFYVFSKPESMAHSEKLLAVVARFNDRLKTVAAEFNNCTLIDPQPLVAACGGPSQALNLRFYYSYKAMYAGPFWGLYAQEVLLSNRYAQSFFYKVLVLDCDNTLWGGVIGEDLLDGIKLDPSSYPGNVFWRIQNDISALQKQGVLICLCSKNNPNDVEEVLLNHPSQLIKNEHIILKKINWNSKVENIQELAGELNLGLESFIFVDDSSFEINSVKEMLPQVTTFQVPKNIYDYPTLMGEVRKLFLAGGVDASNSNKTEQYQNLANAAKERAQFSSFEDYIKSLKIKVDVEKNNEKQVARIAELTQKSNQFNLTSRRYSEAEILSFMRSPDSSVFSLNVSDKFGNSGLTGIAILKNKDKKTLVVDTFLMSCRVIGRTIEFACWDPIFKYFKNQGVEFVESVYLETPKNAQVKDYFDKLNFALVKDEGKSKEYSQCLNDFSFKFSESIEVNCDF